MNIDNIRGGGGWACRVGHAFKQRTDLRGGEGEVATIVYIGNLSLSFARSQVRDLAGLVIVLGNNFDRFDAEKWSDYGNNTLGDETHVNGSSVY